GVAAVVAKGFARIFYRAAVNQGLILIECPEAVDAYREGSTVTFNPDTGEITVDGAVFPFPTLPPEITAIREAGGLLAYTRKVLAEKNLL
nr:3-isopropylmalate dehydratase [bacterium]